MTNTTISTDDLINAIHFAEKTDERDYFDVTGDIFAEQLAGFYVELAARVAAGDPDAVRYQKAQDRRSIRAEYEGLRQRADYVGEAGKKQALAEIAENWNLPVGVIKRYVFDHYGQN